MFHAPERKCAPVDQSTFTGMNTVESQRDWLTTAPMPTLDHLAEQETRDLVIGRRCVTISTYNDIKVFLWGTGRVDPRGDHAHNPKGIPAGVFTGGHGTFCVECGDVEEALSLRPSQEIHGAHIAPHPESGSSNLVLALRDISGWNDLAHHSLTVWPCPETKGDDRLAWGVHFEREHRLLLGTNRRVQTVSLGDASEELLEMMV